MVGIGRLELLPPADDRQVWREGGGAAGHGGKGIAQRDGRGRRVDLDERRERRCKDAVLEEVSLADERVVENPPRGPDGRRRAPAHVPYGAEPRCDVVPVGGVRASRNSGVARIDEPDGRIRKPDGLHARVKRVEGVVLVHEGLRELVPHTRAHRQARSGAPLVLRIPGVEPPDTILRLVRRRPPELRGKSEQEIGGSIPGLNRVERQVAVGAVDERDDHVFPADVEPELQRMRVPRPREVVGELDDLVHALHERLLRVAQREEAVDGDGREPLRQRIGTRHVDAEVFVPEAARDGRVRIDAVVREARDVDRARRQDVRAGPHVVAERGLCRIPDRGGDRRRCGVRHGQQIPPEQRLLPRELHIHPGAHGIAVVFRFRRHDVAIGAGVRAWDELIDQLECRRIQPRRGNLVARERQAREWIADDGAAEVAGTLSVREDDHVRRGAARVAVALVVTEPEDPVLQDRSAETAAVLVLFRVWASPGWPVRRRCAPGARRRG